MTLQVDVQFASSADALPTVDNLETWARAAVSSPEGAELSIRIVDEQEIADLNQRYRDKSGPTNVLAFPADVPAEIGINLLGDVIICAPVVVAEARAHGKVAEAHWAHLVVHGILHLQGLDHQNEAQAAEMETCEVSILARLGYPNPYETDSSDAESGE